MSNSDTITLKQLRALAAIERRGSIAGAAELLNLTAPAVSTQLKMLEQNLGAKLLVRSSEGKGTFTAQGEEVLRAAHRVESTLSHCFHTIESLNSGRSGYIRLGVVSTAKYFAPKIVALAREHLPEIHIDLMVGNRQEIITALESQSVDMAIMGRPPRYPALDSASLGPNPHVLIARPDHPFAGRRDILPAELLEETFILRERGSGTRILLERYLDRIGEGKIYDYLEYATNETIKQAVIAGLGIGLISAHTVIAELEDERLAIVHMPNLPITRQWFLVRPQSMERTPVIDRVCKFLGRGKDDYLPTFAGLEIS